MSQKSIPGSVDLAKAIRVRRNELNMTIEEAAGKAGVGTKTWCRYEAGESIRQDKVKHVCIALGWRTLPIEDYAKESTVMIEDYRKSEYWSKELEESFGATAAASFVIGSEILEDHISEDMDALSHMPKGSHIGELDISFISDYLPAQFLLCYDYNFMYLLRCTLLRIKSRIKYHTGLVAYSVLEELVLFLIVEESRFLLEEGDYYPEDDWDEWIFDIFGDMDLITLLYSDRYLKEDNIYHFSHWLEDQFYVND